MEVVDLDLGARSYGIYIGSGLLTDEALFSKCISGRQVFIVTNETVAPFYLDTLVATLSGHQVDSLVLPDGEQHKNLEAINTIITELLQRRHNRGTTVVALGGGVVGDTAGFAAACYQRGVSLVQVPTTLLSQVDSSVGGKTAVNHALGKNMIGAFHQPQGVVIDTDTLATLPSRELSAGLAEVIKHGVLADADYFAWLEVVMDELRSVDAGAMARAIRRSCEIKAEVVGRDEKETGVRALLNLGHTFGHAMETALGYGQWLHGEAVGAGLVMACDLARRLDMTSDEDCERVRTLVGRAGLPVACPGGVDTEELIELMKLDKKVSDAGARFILPRGLGSAEIVAGVAEDMIRATLESTKPERL